MLDGLTTVSSSLGTCEISQVLLVGGQVIFLGDLSLFPPPTNDWLNQLFVTIEFLTCYGNVVLNFEL